MGTGGARWSSSSRVSGMPSVWATYGGSPIWPTRTAGVGLMFYIFTHLHTRTACNHTHIPTCTPTRTHTNTPTPGPVSVLSVCRSGCLTCPLYNTIYEATSHYDHHGCFHFAAWQPSSISSGRERNFRRSEVR